MTTMIADTAQRSGAPPEGVLARHPLVCFYLLAFAFTWGYWWLIWDPLDLPGLLFPLGGYLGPAVSAFLVTAITSGKSGVLGWLRRCARWRVGVQWYLVALLGVPALMLIALLIIPGALAAFRAPDSSFPRVYLSTFALALLLGGPLGEEVGWRGFALPRLQQRHGPLGGTLIVGALWACWHLPIFFGPASPNFVGPDATLVSASISFVGFLIGLTGCSVLMTWVLNNARGSALLAILLHNSFDTAGIVLSTLFPSIDSTYYDPVSFQTLGGAIVFGGAALVIIVATRGRLSYDRFRREDPDPAPAPTGG
jgi:membrane protease YdiL (CAAX protease family)